MKQSLTRYTAKINSELSTHMEQELAGTQIL